MRWGTGVGVRAGIEGGGAASPVEPGGRGRAAVLRRHPEGFPVAGPSPALAD